MGSQRDPVHRQVERRSDMSLHEYIMSREIAKQDYPFYALIMAAMRQADTTNMETLQYGFPSQYAELKERYNAPGGALNDADVEFLDTIRRMDATSE